MVDNNREPRRRLQQRPHRRQLDIGALDRGARRRFAGVGPGGAASACLAVSCGGSAGAAGGRRGTTRWPGNARPRLAAMGEPARHIAPEGPRGALDGQIHQGQAERGRHAARRSRGPRLRPRQAGLPLFRPGAGSSSGPSAAPTVRDQRGIGRNPPRRSAVPGHRPWPRVPSAARQRRKNPPDPASPPPSADPTDRITNRPKPRCFGGLQLVETRLASLRIVIVYPSSIRRGNP